MSFAAVAGANAALFLRFDPAVARPGEFVTARTEGTGAFIPVPTEAQFAVLFVMSPTRQDLAVLEVDANGDGRARFKVPDALPSGTHLMMAECPSCSPPGTHPVGRLVVAAEDGNDHTGGSQPGDRKSMLRVAVPLLLLVAAGGVVAFRTRLRSSRADH